MLIEFMSDEWFCVNCFAERWIGTFTTTKEPNNRSYNAIQFSINTPISVFASKKEKTDLTLNDFNERFFIGEASADGGNIEKVVPCPMQGMTRKTQHAWRKDFENMLDMLENHFDNHDYVLGGRPSLGDFGLMGPLYGHIFRDPISGFELKTRWPLIYDWVERTNGNNALNARTYGQSLYTIKNGELVYDGPANSDNAEWLENDKIADSLLP